MAMTNPEVAEILGRIALLIEALALIFLACSGPLMWWHARRPKRRKSR